MPRPPRLGELRLGVIKAGREAMTRQRWRDDCAGDRPLPGAIVGHAAAGLENPADVAAMGINHVVVVRAPGARAALAGVAQDQWSADRLPHDRVMSQCSNSGWLGSPRAPRCSSPEARWLSDNASDRKVPLRARFARNWPVLVISLGVAASAAWIVVLGLLLVKAARLLF
jgi:hypothetical protein